MPTDAQKNRAAQGGKRKVSKHAEGLEHQPEAARRNVSETFGSPMSVFLVQDGSDSIMLIVAQDKDQAGKILFDSTFKGQDPEGADREEASSTAQHIVALLENQDATCELDLEKSGFFDLTCGLPNELQTTRAESADARVVRKRRNHLYIVRHFRTSSPQHSFGVAIAPNLKSLGEMIEKHVTETAVLDFRPPDLVEKRNWGDEGLINEVALDTPAFERFVCNTFYV